MTRVCLPLVCLLVLTDVTTAQAQPPRPERPYRGLFGGGVGETEQLLTANVSFGAGYDDNVFADQGSGGNIGVGGGGIAGDPRSAKSGTYTHLAGGLNYAVNRTRVSFNASASATTRRYTNVAGPAVEGLDDFIGAYSGSVGAAWRPSERSSFTVSQTVSLQPYITLGLFPPVFDIPAGQQEDLTLDLDTVRQEHLAYDGTAGFTTSVGRRGSFSLGYSHRETKFDEGLLDLSYDTASTRYTHGIAKGLGLRIGYGYSIWRHPADAVDVDRDRTQGHTIDAGVDFNRALSFSRRTTFSFATGTSAIVDRDRTYYRITGNARLNHEIGRSWNAGVAYDRGLEFLETFRQPLFTDTVNGYYGGFISRRLQLRTGGGWSRGSLGLGASSDFDTYFANAGVTLGLTRLLALGVDSFYYRYRFTGDAELPLGLSPQLDRTGVRAYVTLWAPLVHRARRADASR